MKQSRVKNILFIIGIFIGLFIISQFRANYLMVDDDVKTEKKIIDILTEEQIKEKNKIGSLREEITILQETFKGGRYDSELKYLSRLKELMGITSLKGPGIEIIFSDSENIIRENLDINDKSLVHASDLRDIVNLLRISGALAIAVNDERILTRTPIACVGNSILINKTYMLPPFNIKVIGEADIFLNNLKNQNLIPDIADRVKNNGLVLKTVKKESIEIPIYDGDFSLNFIKEETI